MAAGSVARSDAIDREIDDLGVFGLRPEGRDDRMQRPYPSEPARAPPHRFRPGECANDHWKDFGQHFDRSAARLLDQRDIEVALLRILFNLRLADRCQSGAFEKSLDCTV